MRLVHVFFEVPRRSKMMIQRKITNRMSQRSARPFLAGTWILTLACGALAAACSGTIDTPSEEFPPRQSNGASNTPAPPAPARPAASTPTPSASNSTAAAQPSSAADDEDEEAEDAEDVPAAAEPAETPAPAGDLSFEADVWPIFNSKCAGCHVTAGLGGQNVGSEDLDEALADAKRIEDKLLDDLGTGRMPPGCGAPPGGGNGCVSEEDFAAIEVWYEAGAPE
jgi:hypothetical protein